MLEQGLFNGCSMVVQWLFNGCSMACKRLSPCVVVVGVRGEHECGCGSGFCFVSHEFCFLRVEIRVYWGRCFSWKAWQFFATAWQIFATAWQKIRMPCAVVRQGRCLDVFRDVFLSFLDYGVFYKLRDKERSKESAYVLVGFLARPFVSCVSRIARYHRRLWRTMASDEASERRTGNCGS